ncbi:amino acid/amide ABC transporter substrate-binding protein (HAAT family) [Trichococcus patagoniensis]|uniref:Amino acid/amide ABC transporter substrate-binding protein (HAAT family) n=1 Tax=Trichococcus patagoniensis TaxID=382641 RepID=A0A2T5IMD8_9LACT|nr:ABC transporter substrate-binding protein [Trichococcus patagoniensis]PTQ84981.1 amino acid/amide ABC transporter substrate-binding protein (HAAT family) [Trichococcus patagoniensis]
MKKKLLMGLASVFVLAACGNGATTEESDTIKLGGNFELSGGASAYGTLMDEGIKMAVAEQNAADGLLGKEIEYISYDNKSEPSESTSVATRLATEDNVVAILGPATTGAANAQSPAVTRAKVPAILPAATGDSVTMDGESVLEYVFRVCFQDSFQGKALAEFAQTDLQATKAVILVDNSTDYAIGLADAFKETFEGEIVAEENFTAGDTDFKAILTNISKLDYDVIFLPGYYEEGGLIIKQAREMGIAQPILGPDGFANSTLVELAGADNVDNVFYASHFTPNSEDPKVQDFLAAFEAEYGKPADSFAALAYDAAQLVFDAIATADSTDPQAITDALAATEDFEGVTGNFSFDENHNPVKSAFVIELQDGLEVGNSVVEPAK